MVVRYVLFVRTFEDDSSLWGSYAESTNSCAQGIPDLPTRDNPFLRPTLKEICESYQGLEISIDGKDDVGTLPNGFRKIFDWSGAVVYYDSRADKESLDEFKAGLGLVLSAG